MMMLTQENRRALPALYAQEGKGGEATAYVKFFHPLSDYRLYVTEFDGDDTLFGIVFSHGEWELGYSSLSELTAVRVLGLPMERDRYFTPTTIDTLRTNPAAR